MINMVSHMIHVRYTVCVLTFGLKFIVNVGTWDSDAEIHLVIDVFKVERLFIFCMGGC